MARRAPQSFLALAVVPVLRVLAAVFVLPVLAALGCGDDGGGRARGGEPAPVAALVASVDRARYADDLVFIAAERAPGSAHHAAVADRCATRFEALGFAVERHAYGTGVNVLGVRAGTQRPEERVLVSAHYDHIPGCAGADDDASGVAGVLEVARVLAAPHPRTLVVACWDEEERGLRGSLAYATRLAERGEAASVRAAFVLEMIGYRSDAPGSQQVPAGFDLLFPTQVAELAARENRGDFLLVVTDELARGAAARVAAFAEADALPAIVLVTPTFLKNSPLAADLRRSDHAPFWAVDAPALMLSDSANFRNPRYHCDAGPDDLESLDLDFAHAVVRATVGAVAEALREE